MESVRRANGDDCRQTEEVSVKTVFGICGSGIEAPGQTMVFVYNVERRERKTTPGVLGGVGDWFYLDGPYSSRGDVVVVLLWGAKTCDVIGYGMVEVDEVMRRGCVKINEWFVNRGNEPPLGRKGGGEEELKIKYEVDVKKVERVEMVWERVIGYQTEIPMVRMKEMRIRMIEVEGMNGKEGGMLRVYEGESLLYLVVMRSRWIWGVFGVGMNTEEILFRYEKGGREWEGRMNVGEGSGEVRMKGGREKDGVVDIRVRVYPEYGVRKEERFIEEFDETIEDYPGIFEEIGEMEWELLEDQRVLTELMRGHWNERIVFNRELRNDMRLSEMRVWVKCRGKIGLEEMERLFTIGGEGGCMEKLGKLIGYQPECFERSAFGKCFCGLGRREQKELVSIMSRSGEVGVADLLAVTIPYKMKGCLKDYVWFCNRWRHEPERLVPIVLDVFSLSSEMATKSNAKCLGVILPVFEKRVFEMMGMNRYQMMCGVEWLEVASCEASVDLVTTRNFSMSMINEVSRYIDRDAKFSSIVLGKIFEVEGRLLDGDCMDRMRVIRERIGMGDVMKEWGVGDGWGLLMGKMIGKVNEEREVKEIGDWMREMMERGGGCRGWVARGLYESGREGDIDYERQMEVLNVIGNFGWEYGEIFVRGCYREEMGDVGVVECF